MKLNNSIFLLLALRKNMRLRLRTGFILLIYNTLFLMGTAAADTPVADIGAAQTALAEAKDLFAQTPYDNRSALHA